MGTKRVQRLLREANLFSDAMTMDARSGIFLRYKYSVINFLSILGSRIYLSRFVGSAVWHAS